MFVSCSILLGCDSRNNVYVICTYNNGLLYILSWLSKCICIVINVTNFMAQKSKSNLMIVKREAHIVRQTWSEIILMAILDFVPQSKQC